MTESANSGKTFRADYIPSDTFVQVVSFTVWITSFVFLMLLGCDDDSRACIHRFMKDLMSIKSGVCDLSKQLFTAG